jgi:hypothetical protein
VDKVDRDGRRLLLNGERELRQGSIVRGTVMGTEVMLAVDAVAREGLSPLL